MHQSAEKKARTVKSLRIEVPPSGPRIDYGQVGDRVRSQPSVQHTSLTRLGIYRLSNLAAFARVTGAPDTKLENRAPAQAKLAADRAAKAAANIITADRLAVTQAAKAAEISTQSTGLVKITV